MILEMNLEIFFGIILKNIFLNFLCKNIKNIFSEIILEKYLRNETKMYFFGRKFRSGNVRNCLLISLESLN